MYLIKNATVIVAVLTGLLSMSAVPSLAAQAVYLSDEANYCDMFRALGRALPRECGRPLRVRTIRLHDALASTSFASTAKPYRATEVADSQTRLTGKEGAMALMIPFEFDSAILTRRAQRMLDEVARVLTHETMENAVIQIEGHADSSGAEDYNLFLSSKRARSVQRYLHNRHGVSIHRLPAVGKGEMDPYDWNSPTDSINRRVEFHYLGTGDHRS